jgi:hypothetical protein
MTSAIAAPEAFEQTLHRFFHCLDRFDYAQLVSLTAPDFRWHRQGTILVGHAAVLAALEHRPRTQRIAHLLTNTYVEQSDDASATTHSYMTVYRHDDGTLHDAPVTIGGPVRINQVTARFARSGSTWKMTEQIMTPEFNIGSTHSSLP